MRKTVKILILQIGDIHIASEDDAVLGRATAIVDAVKNFGQKIDLCVCVVTGDIAFSGADEEYYLAWEWLEKMIANLEAQLSWTEGKKEPKVQIVLVPGNHDCNFTGSSQVRDMVIQTLHENGLKDLRDEVIELCTSVQSSYFQFMSSIDGHQDDRQDLSSYLRYERVFQEEDESVRFICLNTAWLSSRDEQQGRLLFPEEIISPNRELNSVEIAVMHHPYNWIESENGRALRNRLESVADIVLTGHEHGHDSRVQTRNTGERNTYIEGGILQSTSNMEQSVFNAILIDTVREKQKIGTFSWDGSLYRNTRAQTLSEDKWEEFQINRLRTHGQFEVSKKTREFLDDSGLIQRQSDGSTIALSEIFVFPDLVERHLVPKKNTMVIKGIDVLDLALETKYLLISGDDECGKTSLAKMLYSELFAKSKVPVFIDCSKTLPKGDALYPAIKGLVEEQYSPIDLAIYEQLDRSAKVAIVDDIHKLSPSSPRRQKFIETLREHFEHIVIFSNDLSLLVEDGAFLENFSSDAAFRSYTISKFGNLKRFELLERWVVVQGREDLSPTECAEKLHTSQEIIDNCIGTNFVPSYPVYILALLQATEAMTLVDTRSSTHGHFYELLIMNSLARGRSNREFNVITNYLAYLAFQLFEARKSEFSKKDLNVIHANFCSLLDISLSIDSILKFLLDCHMLRTTDFGFRFKYKFIYFYFTGAYFRDHLDEEGIKSAIARMSRNLHVEEFANIMLFLTHLSSDPSVIQEMLNAASEIYESEEKAKLEKDVEFLNGLSAEVQELEVEYDDGGSARRAALEAKDAHEGNSDEASEVVSRRENEETEPLDLMSKLGASLKTVQILGQVLKNYPGSLTGDRKLEIAEACYDAGRRTITPILDALEKEKDDMVLLVLQVLRERFPGQSNDRLEARANETVTGMAQLILFYLVRRISMSVGSPQLEVTYGKILGKDESTAVRLIDVSIYLDQFGNLPLSKIEDLAKDLESNKTGLNLLRTMVAEHLMLFDDTSYKQKKKFCDLLEISLKKTIATSPSKKLITKSDSASLGKPSY